MEFDLESYSTAQVSFSKADNVEQSQIATYVTINFVKDR